MIDSPPDAQLAARLIYFGLNPKLRPAQDPEYQALVDRYLDSDAFATLTREIAEGLTVRILRTSAHGIVVVPHEGSAFAMSAGDYRAGTARTAEDRLLDGLVQIAIAARVYPTPRELTDDLEDLRPPLVVEDIEETMRNLCEKLEAESRANPDPNASDEERGLQEAWRVYHRRPSAIKTKDDRDAARATMRLIRKTLDAMCEHGLFTRITKGKDTAYRPTWRYQTLVQEMAASYAYQRVTSVLQQGAA